MSNICRKRKEIYKILTTTGSIKYNQNFKQILITD